MKLVVRVQVSADGKYSGFPIRDNRGREHLLLVLKVTFAVDPAGRAELVYDGPAPYACDELCGFLVACALVTPGKSLREVEPASVRKKLKRADFARAVNRQDIVRGAEELGVPLDEHIAFVLEALRGASAGLDL